MRALSRHFKTAVAAALLIIVLVVIGCGGSGSGTSGTVLSGKAAQRAAAIAGVQSLVAGQNYPFQILNDSMPGVIKAVLKRPASGSGLTLVEDLGLYQSAPSYVGSEMTISYYTNSQGTTKAGTLTATNSSGAAFDQYSSYPSKVAGTISLTTGAIPCSGNVTIDYTDSKGANTIKGALALSKTGISLGIDLSLSDAGAVGGGLNFTENGNTLAVTNVTGNLTGTLTGDVTVTPENWTGTASFSLATGAYSLTLNTSGGKFTATLNSSGDLAITYPDGTTAVVTNPTTASLTSGGTTGSTSGGSTGTTGTTSGTTGTTSGTTGTTSGTTGTTSGTTGTTSGTTGTTSGSTGSTGAVPYNNPVKSNFSGYPQGKNNVGAIAAYNIPSGVGGNPGVALYYASATSTPQTLALASGDTSGEAYGLNDSAQIVGQSNSGGTSSHALYWSSPTAAASTLAVPTGTTYCTANSINNAGQIVGVAKVNGTFEFLYWATASSTPQVLAAASQVAAQIGAGGDFAFTINNSGQIFIWSGNGIQGSAAVWASPTAQPTILADTSGNTGDIVASRMNASGTVVGYQTNSTNTGIGATWSSPSYKMATLAGGANSKGLDINDSGQITGSIGGLGTIWNSPSANPVTLNAILPSGTLWSISYGIYIFNNANIYGFGYDNGDNGDYFLITPVSGGRRRP